MKTSTRMSVGAAAVLAIAGAASGDIIGNAITIRAYNPDNMSDSAEWSFSGQDMIDSQGNLAYSMTGDIDLIGSVSGEVLATIDTASVNFIADPVIDLNFDVLGGVSNSVIVVESGELTFGNINNAVASASAALSVTDNQFFPGGAGASITPTGSAAYLANTNGLAPSGQNFASLFSSPIAFSGGTQTFNDSEATSVIAGSTSSMSSRFGFTLSALDFVSATSTFSIVPAPSGLALIGLGSMFVGARRRR